LENPVTEPKRSQKPKRPLFIEPPAHRYSFYGNAPDFMNAPLILLCGLGGWWLLLTWFAIRSYLERVEDAKIPLTPEDLAECRRFEADTPRKPPMRARDYLVVGPVMALLVFMMLPLCLYAWFLKHRDPYDRHTKA
jgi:hypothetical protein